MRYKTHALGGLLFGVTTMPFLSIPLFSVEGVIWLSGSVLGSLLPDIDHPNSYIGKRLKPLSFAINKTFGHRGITHTLLFVFLISFLFWLLSLFLIPSSLTFLFYSFFVGCVIGIVSHLVLDMSTKSGVPLFYPISKKNISILPIKTGSFGETIYFICLGIILVLYVYVYYA